ncbi:unnamed protein product [Effrenium voratum]|uniref:Uncharacterized protein n=1 Tax=Effrenium voratum TaxID=2562239 RepID=A0AA36JA73_9DINO|nr:unnamed protein product [Effrenium voratum]
MSELALTAVRAALQHSADRAPVRSEESVFSVSKQKWLSPAEASKLSAGERSMLLSGLFQVRKGRTNSSNCKRCGRKMEKASMQIGYPSTDKEKSKTVAVWLHVACAKKDEGLVQLASQGRKAMKEHVLGFDALSRQEQKQLVEQIHAQQEEEEEEPGLPESQVAVPPKVLEAHETPTELKCELKEFQKQGLTWMLAREDVAKGGLNPCGGILADEMGMGKTLEVIALLLASEETPTLIVVPPTCLMQWRLQIQRFVAESIEVHTYQGVNRNLPELEPESKKRVVLTTYNVLERDFRKQVDLCKVPCEFCKRRFWPEGLLTHQRHCKQADQEAVYAKRKQAAALHHSKRARREEQAEAEATVDKQEIKKEGEDTEVLDLWEHQLLDKLDLSSSPLYRVQWGRVVLDEAHRIRSSQRGSAQAAFNLQARKRWCVSGTPMQNRIGEVYSLVRFLRYYPYGYYRCTKRGCTCECFFVPCFPDTSVCKGCSHSRSLHQSIFQMEISTPIRQFGFLGKGKEALEALRLHIFHRLMLRRTKCISDLPELTVTLQKVALSAREQRFYASVREAYRPVLEDLLKNGQLMRNFAHVFSIIMRQRQAANHPDLVKFGTLQSRCHMCQAELGSSEETVALGCGHCVHEICFEDYGREACPTKIFCPSCQLSVERILGENGLDFVEELQKSKRLRSCSKIEALLAHLRKVWDDATNKVLVFSQFTHFLEIIEWHLQQEGMEAVRMCGNTKMRVREEIMQNFADPASTCRILLISLQVGGEGLNLQSANHVFLMDPWWNPAAEQQAMQRAHRIGQTRPVQVVRFVSANTIEDKILDLQAKKQCTFDSTVAGCNESLLRLSCEDIQLLFKD